MPELTATNQRYIVTKVMPHGYQITDTTGQDEPYVISLARDTATEMAELDERLAYDSEFGYDDYELALVSSFREIDGKYVHCHDPAYMSQEAITRMEEHDLKTAQGWCDTWNLVESGHCGSCKKQFEPDEKRYPAVGYDRLYKTLCFYCACSRED